VAAPALLNSSWFNALDLKLVLPKRLAVSIDYESVNEEGAATECRPDYVAQRTLAFLPDRLFVNDSD
jgi:hypothetical protein